MKIGTKSLLYGAHLFWWHPILVFISWWKLFGFPWNPRLWIAFIIHDWGYWGKPNMDGPEGEFHVIWAASWMAHLFGCPWGVMTACHSRHWAKKTGRRVSTLGIADKYSATLEPRWFYLLRTRATGEIREFQQKATHHQEVGFIGDGSWQDDCTWFGKFKYRMIEWTLARIHYRDYNPFPLKEPV
jgi:hypothetical protein